MIRTTALFLAVLATASAQGNTTMYHCVKESGGEKCLECAVSEKGCLTRSSCDKSCKKPAMYECEAATKKCVESKKGTESKTKCEETCKPPPPPSTKYICDVTSAKCVAKTNGPETKSNCEKTCKHWVPPVLRDIQYYEIIYDRIPTLPDRMSHYNGTYWCDKTDDKFREDLRKGDNWKVLEERDVQSGEIKWYSNYDTKPPQCHAVTNPGKVGCFIEQYPDSVCYEETTTYRCTKSFKDAPIPYSYTVYYAKASPHYPTEVGRSDLTRTIRSGKFMIYNFREPGSMSAHTFAKPCNPSTPTLTSQLSCGGAVCPAYDTSCCPGPKAAKPGSASCYEKSTQSCCISGPGKGHVCPKGKCSTKAGFICD